MAGPLGERNRKRKTVPAARKAADKPANGSDRIWDGASGEAAAGVSWRDVPL